MFGVADAEGAEEDGQDRDGARWRVEDRGLFGVVAYVAQQGGGEGGADAGCDG